jgi:tyrosinase
MTHVRKDISKLGAEWNPTVLWYAKAVGAMQQRAVTDVTSWRFLGAMHGVWPQLWTAFGYLKAGEKLPTAAVQARYWKQCQHQSWYFLPWHRGYLAAFEAIVRKTIHDLGGPADDWALPYWNYDPAHAATLALPAAFAAAKLPDGSANPLFVARRYGHGPGKIKLRPVEATAVATLKDGHFTGGSDGVPPGFGGPQGAFHHGGENDQAPSGGVESQPHNNVHVAVGGQAPNADPNDPRNLGLMTNPDTAALDPIFWVHHANIDRLWESWLSNPAHKNPTDATWLKGPADRVFAMPKPDGGEFTFTAKDMLDTKAPLLDYTYQALAAAAAAPSRRTERLNALSAQLPAIAAFMEAPVAQQPQSEVIGKNDGAVQLSGDAVETEVRLDPAATAKVAGSFAPSPALAAAASEPDRVFLKLENIRSVSDAGLFDVYVGLPAGADPEQHPELLAGVLSLFGVSKASRTDGGHSGNGLTQVLEITPIVDALHLQHDSPDLDRLRVRFVPRTAVTDAQKVSVGAVSVLRLGA